jgi:hypothetical protein
MVPNARLGPVPSYLSLSRLIVCSLTRADLMNACWHPDPEKRPQFKEIVKRIERAQKARIFDTQDREEATTFGNKGAISPPPPICAVLTSLLFAQYKSS